MPRRIQYLDLVRDATFAFALLDLPANNVEYQNSLTGECYISQDSKNQRGVKASKLYDALVRIERLAREKRNKGIRSKGKEKPLKTDIGDTHHTNLPIVRDGSDRARLKTIAAERQGQHPKARYEGEGR